MKSITITSINGFASEKVAGRLFLNDAGVVEVSITDENYREMLEGLMKGVEGRRPGRARKIVHVEDGEDFLAAVRSLLSRATYINVHVD
jgi:hypothetical protein